MREYGSEHPAIILPDGYFEDLSELGREVLYLRSGREALLLTAIAACDAKDKTILFPVYCCWSMSAPFEKAGWKVVYYRLNEDLTVDTDYLKYLLLTYKPQAVLTMNFYGSASTEAAVKVVKEFDKKIKVIEDFSHCTFSIRQIMNPEVDMYVSSIRKSVGVCDGSVILSKEPMPKQYIQEEQKDFADKRFVAQTEKKRYTWSKDQEKKLEFLSTICECEGIIDGFTAVRPISERAKKMLAMVNGEEIAFARRENMRHLWTRLNEFQEASGGSNGFKLVPGLERSFEKEGSSPFSLPILVENRDEIQGALAKRGVYTQWLWPLCDEAVAICPVSKEMNEKMLSVPIDQRFSWDDIEEIANIIIDVVKNKNMQQKRLLVLAAGILQITVIKKAKAMGYYVIAADGDPNACGFNYADKAICANITDEEVMLKIAREERVDGVIHPCSEVSMNVMGRINEVLGLAGITKEQAIRATNKHLMREAFEKGNAPSPKSILTESSEDAWNHLQNDFEGTDAILKPSRNSGSRGIAKVTKNIDKSEFIKAYEIALEESRDKSVLIEQFIEGPEFSIEIIVWNGKVNVLTVTDKKTTEAPHFVELGHNQPSCHSAEEVETLKAAAVAGVKALGVNNCACHAEAKLMDGKAYLMEIGARLGGDFISTELTHLSTGIDMVAAAVNVALGVEPDLSVKEEPKGACIRYMTPKPGKLVSISNTEVLDDPRVYKKKIYVQIGDEIPEVTSSLCRSGHVIVTEKTSQAAIELAERLISEVKLETE